MGETDWTDRGLFLSLNNDKMIGMKKILVLATAALLLSASSFAYNGDKGKDKGKKPAPKTCSGKQCCKKKAS
jgi:hypothetical protein